MPNYRLRLKDPSGAEFEAEGPADFILGEKTSFLQALKTAQSQSEEPAEPRAAAEPWEPAQGPREPGSRPAAGESAFWHDIIDLSGSAPKLRIKSPEISAAEAALILMAANRAIYQNEHLDALTLSKALKNSGYAPDRLDRLLAREIKEGKVTASGAKRNRTYHITRRGLERSYGAINRLHRDGNR